MTNSLLNNFPVNDNKFIEVSNPEELRKICKKHLDNHDYEEFLLAIMDMEYYDLADPEIQSLVDDYYSMI